MRARLAVLLVAACAAPVPQDMSFGTSTRPPAAPSEPPSPPADVPADPVEALRRLLPPDSPDRHEPDAPPPLWRALEHRLQALPAGRERDELLRRGLAAADTWPDDLRQESSDAKERWAAGQVPSGWPLVRSVHLGSAAEARRLLARDALAGVTILRIHPLGLSDPCDRLDELFAALADSPQLARVHTLSLALPGCAAPELLLHLDRLRLPALRRLVLPGWIGPREAAVLAERPLLAGLVELDLSDSKPQAAGLAALARSPHLRQLEVLRLRHTFDSTAVSAALADTPAWTGLRELDLSSNIFTRPALRQLGRNPALAGLEALDLGHAIGVNADTLPELVRAGGLPRLAVLRLGGDRIGDAGVAAITGATRWSLRELVLSRAHIGPRGALALARATHLRSLERLDLAGNDLGPVGGRSLAEAPFLGRLRHLDLSRCGLGEAAAAAIVARLADPEALLLGADDLGDGGARAIAARTDWTRLRALDVSRDGIGPDGVVALAAAPQLASLRRFDVSFNRPGEPGWRALVESPHLARFVTDGWRQALELLDTRLGPDDAARPIPADFELRLDRRGCFGPCPVFTVTVRADGSFDYRGERHVRDTGPVTDRVALERVKLILSALARFEATEPGKRVACNVRVFDDETFAVRVRRGGRTVEYASESLCPTAPAYDAMTPLAYRISFLLDTDRWTWID